jgi:hypothetical protein
MIYEKDNIYYLKKGNAYEIANIFIKYNRIKKRNVIVVTGSGEYINDSENPSKYSFKELQEKLTSNI